jgi:OmcA/MtrC family decaheme c-type cytochrome
VESCTVCHGATAIADAAAIHVVTGVPTISNVAFALGEVDLVVTFNLQVDGVDASENDGFALNSADRFFESAPGEYTLEDLEDAGTPAVLSGGVDGNFTITIQGGAVYSATNSRYEFRVQKNEPTRVRALVVADYPDVAYVDVVSNEGCQACHSQLGVGIHRSYPMGAQQCVVCHSSDVGRYAGRFNFPFVGIIHGVHNAHNFPEGKFVYEEDDPATERNELTEFETTFPSYMNNCSLCHTEPDMLAAANSMTITAENCFTCHGSTEGIPFREGSTAEAIHANILDGCEACHAGQIGGIPQTVADAHNGGITGNDGVIWNGEDVSVTEGALFDWEITAVDDDGTDLTITWQASYAGNPVNPCNATAGEGAPVFFADGTNGENLSILRNYAQGEDFILGTRTDRPQPGGTPGLDNDNTTCDGLVATTVIPVEPTDAMYGRVAIQGKPRLPNIDPEPDDPAFVEDFGSLMPVRAKTPTFDWVIGEGGAAPQERRAIVDTTGKCLKCHVGSLYQHGGNRVDNVDMCILCHNSAANDQYVRAGMGVDASEAYDGQAGEAFEMKTMLHAIHSSGEAEIPFVIYRGRGIYAWARDVSLVPNWPTEEDCVRSNGQPGSTVFGSEDECQVHNFHSPTYPRRLYDCGACHVEGFAGLFPDATKAMATTVESGEDFGSASGLTDDVLEGASSASCMSCHKQFAPTEGNARSEYNALGAHAAQNGWEPQAFPEGRQTIIDANE